MTLRRRLVSPTYVLAVTLAALPIALLLPRAPGGSPLLSFAVHGLPVLGAAFLLMGILLVSPTLVAPDAKFIPDMVTVPTLHPLSLIVSTTLILSAKNSLLATPNALEPMGAWLQPQILLGILGLDLVIVYAIVRRAQSKLP